MGVRVEVAGVGRVAEIVRASVAGDVRCELLESGGDVAVWVPGECAPDSEPKLLHETLVLEFGRWLDTLGPERPTRLILLSSLDVAGWTVLKTGVGDDFAAGVGVAFGVGGTFGAAMGAMEKLAGVWADEIGATLIVLRLAPFLAESGENVGWFGALERAVRAGAKRLPGPEIRWSAASPATVSSVISRAIFLGSAQSAGRALVVADTEPVGVAEWIGRFRAASGLRSPSVSLRERFSRKPDSALSAGLAKRLSQNCLGVAGVLKADFGG